MKYSELPYERVDVEKTRNLMKEYLEKFSNAESFNEQANVILDVNEHNKEYHSYTAMASLNLVEIYTMRMQKQKKITTILLGPI